jgi:hypothetical protein
LIREYALNPELAAIDSNTLHRVFSEFGGENGRVLADVPHQWAKTLQRLIQKKKDFSAMERRSCFDELARLQKSGIVKRDAKVLGGDSWLERTNQLNAIEPFNGILSDSADRENNQFRYERMFGSYPDDWVIDQTKSIKRTAVELAGSISQSLNLSTQVLFVDPYFYPLEDRYRVPFMAFANKVINGRYGSKKIFVHTCEQNYEDDRRKNRTDLERGLEECIQPQLPDGFSVEMWIWPNSKLHDRFVLTNIIGHAFGHGLDEQVYQGAIEVNVNRLSCSARDTEFRKFSRAADRLGEAIVVIGSS